MADSEASEDDDGVRSGSPGIEENKEEEDDAYKEST